MSIAQDTDLLEAPYKHDKGITYTPASHGISRDLIT